MVLNLYLFLDDGLQFVRLGGKINGILVLQRSIFTNLRNGDQTRKCT